MTNQATTDGEGSSVGPAASFKRAQKLATDLLAYSEGCENARRWGDPTIYPRHPIDRSRARTDADALAVVLSAFSARGEGTEAVAWACKTCNSPRAVDPCPKCGTALTKPADGWEWPFLPDIDRIRELAREVGYAVGVHGTLERDLDLIAVPWVAEAVGPLELAQHIAVGLGGAVIDYEPQDKPAGRWSCNIHPGGWLKIIDLSVMPAHPSGAEAPSVVGAETERGRYWKSAAEPGELERAAEVLAKRVLEYVAPPPRSKANPMLDADLELQSMSNRVLSVLENRS